MYKLREQIRVGLIAAREEGRIGGRRQKLSDKQQTEIVRIVQNVDKPQSTSQDCSTSTRQPSAGSSPDNPLPSDSGKRFTPHCSQSYTPGYAPV